METARVTIGLTTAVLLPRGLPYVSRSIVANAMISVAYALYALDVSLAVDRKVTLTALVVAWSTVSAATTRPAAHANGTGPIRPRFASRLRDEFSTIKRGTARIPQALRKPMYAVTALSIVTVVAFGFITDSHTSDHFVSVSMTSDKTFIVLSGIILAVFVCHEPVVRISSKATGSVLTSHEDLIAVDQPGVYIGWLERAVVFAFVAGGAADAAGLALAAKSLARYPAIEREEITGEYFIAGTFLSVLSATVVGIGTRLALGMAPL